MPPLPDFESIVDSHYGALFRFAMSLTRHESNARDLTQQTFLIWARKGHQLQDGGKVKAWLFTTMHRQFLQARRRSDRFPETGLADAGVEELTETPRPGAGIDAGRLLDVMARLSPALRAPLALFYLEDYSYPKIAEFLDIPLGTVKSRISRGVAQLQNLLEPDPAAKPGTRPSS